MPTIGVALAVPEPWGQQLQDYRTSLGDVAGPLIPTHITLLPPAEVAPDEMAEVEDHLAAVALQHEPFAVHLRGTGTFRPVSPVVFVSVVAGISDCERLAREIRRGPWAVDPEFPYHPHVTIAHLLPDEVLDRAFVEQAGFECTFDIADLHLYTHDDTAGWRPTRAFPLTVSAP